jgi:hypothetical protein
MREDSPAVYLLAGPAKPAKEAYVRALLEHGVVEVPPGSPDQVLVEHIQTGRDAFLDRDQLLAEDRERFKALVEEHGGQWCLITFTVDHAPLAARLGGSGRE